MTRRTVRICAAALALLWGLVPAIGAVHGAVEAHAYCLEHQAFEHVEHGHDHSEGTQLTPEHGDEHGQCAFGDMCLFTASHDAVEAVAPVAPAGDTPDVASQLETPVIAILAVAPKSSPPRA